jgi:hypothetical protein
MFHEDIYDALKSAVKCLGGSKAVGQMLWPEKTMAAAQSYLNDCLNAERDAKLDPAQVLLLLRWARECGCHEAAEYIMEQAGYEKPVPREPQDELADLLRRYLDSQDAAGKLQPRIEELRSKLKAV